MIESQDAYRGNGSAGVAPLIWQAADSGSCREAMSRLAAGVVVVMTRDTSGTLWGFTATSLCSVSLDPPLVLTCVALSSSSYPAFMSCDGFAVSVLHEEDVRSAERFARSGAEKFRDAEAFILTPYRQPTLPDALCRLDCRIYSRHPAGDHVILVGEVRGVSIGAGEPLVYFHRNYRTLGPQASGPSGRTSPTRSR